MKRCSRCEEALPESEFYRNGARLRGDCKRCILDLRRLRYAAESDTLEARVHAYRQANPDKVAATEARRRSLPTYKASNRRGHLRRYGLSPADFDALLAVQEARCAVCRSTDPGKCWTVDHDHVTGAVRGILCWHCNVGLGHFRDDPESLIAAAQYVMAAQPAECVA